MGRVVGDLLELALNWAFDAVVHGCNFFHAMDAGIAKAIAKRFPEVVEADRSTPCGDVAKLGTISTAEVVRGSARFLIVNACTQFHHSGHGRKVDYDAVISAFHHVARQFPSARIGYPLVGAGLAEGDRGEIAPRIKACLAGHRHTLVEPP